MSKVTKEMYENARRVLESFKDPKMVQAMKDRVIDTGDRLITTDDENIREITEMMQMVVKSYETNNS